MLTYEPDDTVAHRLDPRSKLLLQAGFAVAAFTHRTPRSLAVLSVLALGILAAVRLSPVRVLRASWVLLCLLGLGVAFAAFVPRPPWIVPERALESALSGYRVVLVLFVAGAYVRSTPVRDTRAAIQRHVPGRPGQLLGVGIALVYRFFPVLVADLRTVRDAIRARGGQDRPIVDRTRRFTLAGLHRAFARADRLSVALRARAFAYNPTLPALRFGRADVPTVVLAFALTASPLVTAVFP